MTHKIRVAVSGSFHRHMSAIASAVEELTARGAQVLSPADPRVVDQHDEFLFVASDRLRSVRLVQDRHLEAIRSADFLWLVSPDGYVGQSASMELGFAAAVGIPIIGLRAPNDLTLRQYVTLVPTLPDALRRFEVRSYRRPVDGILIDPHATIAKAHRVLEALGNNLTVNHGTDEARNVHRDTAELRRMLSLPSAIH